MIRVILPPHLRTLARVNGELELQVKTPVSQRAVLDAIEAKYPMLRGTIRDHVTQLRRPMVRFFACGEDRCFSVAVCVYSLGGNLCGPPCGLSRHQVR